MPAAESVAEWEPDLIRRADQALEGDLGSNIPRWTQSNLFLGKSEPCYNGHKTESTHCPHASSCSGLSRVIERRPWIKLSRCVSSSTCAVIHGVPSTQATGRRPLTK